MIQIGMILNLNFRDMSTKPSNPATRALPLSALAEGDHARIHQIMGGRELARRLLGLGLRVGTELQVLQHRGHGVVVARSGSRIALGAGVVEKLLVTPLSEGS